MKTIQNETKWEGKPKKVNRRSSNMLDNKLQLKKPDWWFSGTGFKIQDHTDDNTNVYIFVKSHHNAPLKLVNVTAYKLHFKQAD